MRTRDRDAHAARRGSALRYAGCDETGCPLRLRETMPVDPLLDPLFAIPPVFVIPPLPIELPPERAATELEHEVAARHRKLIVVNRFEY